MPKSVKSLPTLNQVAGQWQFYGGADTGYSPIQMSPGVWYFNMPHAPGQVNYILHQHWISLQGNNSLEVYGEIQCSEPPPLFDCMENGGIPPSFRILLWRKGRDTGDINARWWSNPQCVMLKPGVFSLIVSLAPENWTNVYNHLAENSLEKFNECLQNTGDIGLSFGGGSSFGHGIRLQGGTAKFVCSRFTLN